MMRHAPNLLSALRLLAAPLAAWLVIFGHDTLALCVFACAGLSDALDGAIARHWGFTSRFGAWLDPAADKLLMLLCFLALYAVGAAPLWLAALVVTRDAMIAAGWLLTRLLSLSLRFEALPIGKVSTLVQILYIGLLLVLLAFDLDAPRLTLAAAWTTAIFTSLSGAAYGAVLLRGLSAGRRAVL